MPQEHRERRAKDQTQRRYYSLVSGESHLARTAHSAIHSDFVLPKFSVADQQKKQLGSKTSSIFSALLLFLFLLAGDAHLSVRHDFETRLRDLLFAKLAISEQAFIYLINSSIDSI